MATPLKMVAGVAGDLVGGVGYLVGKAGQGIGNVVSLATDGKYGSDLAKGGKKLADKSASLAKGSAKWIASPLAILPGLAGGAGYVLGKAYDKIKAGAFGNEEPCALTKKSSELIDWSKNVGGLPTKNLLGGMGNIVDGVSDVGVGVMGVGGFIPNPYGQTVSEMLEESKEDESTPTPPSPQPQPQPGAGATPPTPGGAPNPPQPPQPGEVVPPGPLPGPNPPQPPQPSPLGQSGQQLQHLNNTARNLQQGQTPGRGTDPLLPSGGVTPEYTGTGQQQQQPPAPGNALGSGEAPKSPSSSKSRPP